MKKIPVWKNILLIFSLIATIIIATLAWFYIRPLGTVEGMMVNVGKATYVQISGDNGNTWDEDLEVEYGINKNFKEISGNGTTFFSPSYDVLETPDALIPTISSFQVVTAKDAYYEEEFSFRSDTDQDIYLTPDSFVKATGEDGSAFIDGAIRVAFFEVDNQGKETLKYIWAPNSTKEYQKGTDSFITDGQVETYYRYQISTTPVDDDTLASGVSNGNIISIPTTASGSCAYCGYHSSAKFMWSCGEHLPENAPVLTRVQKADGQDFGYSKIKIRVWLEGYDRECVPSIKGQRFTMKFHFSTERGE